MRLGEKRAHENERENLRAENEAMLAKFEDNEVASTTVKQAVYLLLRVCLHLLKREQVASKAE